MASPIAPEIFKAYDIRGIVDRTLTEEAAELIGRGLGTMGAAKGVKRFVVGRDGRLSGPRLVAALTRGLNAAGMDVTDIGVVATPMVYFATHELRDRQRRHGDRQPQPARVQRPQDDGGGRHARLRRRSRTCAG